MDQLITKQSADAKIIQKIINNFRKDSAGRKTKEYCAARLQSLNTVWQTFEQRNTDIEQYKNQFPQHKYFEENYFNKVEVICEEGRETLENALRDAIERTKNTEILEQQLKNIRRQTALIESLQRAIERTKMEISTQTSTAFFTQKIKLLNDYWEHIVINHGEIMSGGKFKNDYFDTEVFPQTEDQYQAVLIELQERLNTLTPQKAEIPESHNQTNQKKNRVKLPNIDIPVFDGDYLKWQSFRDLFSELIHKDDKIAKAEKLFYLKTNLKGEPNELIQHLSITNENYDTAWSILDKRYNNKRALVTAQLRTLLNQPELTKESSDGLKKLHDTATECLQAIKNLGIETANWDALVIFLLTEKFDKETHRLYEQSLTSPREVQTLTNFLEFIENRFQGLEAIEPSKRNTNNKQIEKKERYMRFHHGTIKQQSCTICKGDHKIYGCEKFSKLSTQQKLEAVKRAKLCTNCLTKGHAATICKSWRRCKVCNKNHHTLLHLSASYQNVKNPKPQSCGENAAVNNQPTEITTHVTRNKIQHTVLLATAVINALDRYGNSVQLRALVDQGAQGTLITEDAAQKLRITRRKINAIITGVGEANAGTIQTCVSLTIRPRFHSTFELCTTALVMQRLTKVLPSERVTPSSWEYTRNLILADPTFDTPGRIDIILGADVFSKILLNNVLRGEPGSPIAQETELGWILSGEINNARSGTTIQCFISEVDISKELRRFWESEELQGEQVMTSEDIACENHFKATHRRGSDGRYTVRIPFRENPDKAGNLDGSRQLAFARLFQMERKFKNNVVFSTMYKEFMKEYIRLGHMVPTTDDIEQAYYLPHHAVLKQDSTTTKLRVVFDASAKRNNTKCLNELMMVGPQLQESLHSILLRWRKHKIVFTADIEKMYRQIKIDNRDQNYQRILWRESTEDPIQEYKLTTVTYGTASAPFLAIRTLQQLAKDDERKYPAAANIIMQDTYVDDIVSGGSSLNEVVESSKQLISLLKGGGFNPRKWSSNNKAVLKNIPSELKESGEELDFDKDKTIKALGVYWNPSTDNLKIQVNIDAESNPSSKRELLSEAAKVYDPMGLLAPVTVKIKLLFQEIWLQELQWDEKLPTEIQGRWARIKSELPSLQKIPIARWIGYTGKECRCELHGFSDASEGAYGAAIYLRVLHGKEISTSLVTAKTKVAPLKSKLSLPRLELCGAALLANLMKETQNNLNIKNLQCYAWTDSTIVLAWIQENPHKWKTFVGNRVAEIQAIIDTKNWHHVKSQDNPADVASRGVYPSQLENLILWWQGPQWLKEKTIKFPERLLRNVEQERKKVVVNTTINEDENILTRLLQRYSSLGKVQRVLAHCNRFINNCKLAKGLRNVNPLTIDEIDTALTQVIKYTQGTHFKEQIGNLMLGRELHKASRLYTLSPFLDNNQLLRVGGRLDKANLAYDQKHPIILPYKSDLTTLTIDKAHKEALHGGNSLTLELTRQRFWILQGLKAVKGHIHKCTKCHRYKAQMSHQMMGLLPTARVVPSPPFTHTGVDYAGPFDLLLTRGRGSKTQKGYLSIFICLTSKAIHIEVVTDLTSKAFIAAFKRFTNRRGPVAHLYSDNATNFVGASKIISDLHKLDSYQTDVNIALQEAGTQWHFIPPASPHFGGLWEAGVKSIKYHMRRVVGESKLTYEEMCTLMTQIEACLNSRPLCPLSEDPESLEVLTPGHFLRGSAMLSIPDKDLLESNPNLLDRWDRIDRMKQEFWRKWSIEYLGRLQHRPKWAYKQEEVKKGNLVLIKDEQMPTSRWALGRIIETHPGTDGLTRVVTLQTRNGKFKRPITKISLLPVSDNKEVKDPTTQEPMQPNDEVDSDSDINTTAKSSVMANTAVTQTYTPRNRKRHTSIDGTRKSKSSRYDQQASGSSTATTVRLQEESGSSTTNAVRPQGLSNWSSMFLLSLFIVVALSEDIKKPYELTRFTNQEGIYFDHISELQLYSNEWNLLVYYDLTTYWKEYNGIKTSIRKLNTLCEQEVRLSRDLCTATLQQLNHQMLESEHINEILYQQNEHIRTRSKRAPIEIIGTISNKLFGILDQEFADKYEKQINEIKRNENLVRQLLTNQTSMMENTVNIMKKNHDTVQHQISTIEKQIDAITTTLNHAQYEVMAGQAFNSAALLVTLSILSFQNIQRSILSVVTDTKHGRVNTLLLTPSQLTDQLKIIREHLPNDSRLPGNGSATSLMAIYNSMHINIRVTENNVLFDIRIALLNAEMYDLYEPIPIPAIHNNEYIYIEPSSKYLAVNHRRDRFSPMREEHLRACQKLIENQLICSLKQPIFTVRSNQSHCEIELLSNERKISPFCKLKNKAMENTWIKLHKESTWLFILHEETHIDIACEKILYPITLSGNGIIQLQQDCIINHPTLYIHSNNKAKSNVQSLFIPEHQVLSTHLNLSTKLLSNTSKVAIPQLIKEVTSNDLAELDDAIKHQQQQINEMPNWNLHDLHHYTSTYGIIGIMITAGLYLRYRRQQLLRRRGLPRPIPAPRRNTQEEGHQTSLELPTFNLEGGECTQYI